MRSGGAAATVDHLESCRLTPVAAITSVDQLFDQVHAPVGVDPETNAPALEAASEMVSPNNFEMFHSATLSIAELQFWRCRSIFKRV